MIFSDLKLIGLDLDGTLLGADSLVHEPEARAVQQARRAGVSVALATGRSMHDALPHAAAAGGVDWFITENGARVTSADGSTIYEDALSSGHLHTLLDLCEQYGVEPSFYGKGCVWYGSECRAFFAEVARQRGGTMPIDMEQYRYVDTADAWRALADTQTVYKAIVYGDTAQLDEWMEKIQASGRFEAEPSVYCGMKNVEINRKGTNKGHALLSLAQRLGLHRSQVMACGDSDNDRAMLHAAGLGVAMANAPLHIRNMADAVTGTNENHGVCQAIEQYILHARKHA